LKITCPSGVPGAQLLWLGRSSEKGVDLAVRKQLDRVDLRLGDPPDVLGGVEPDMGGGGCQEYVSAIAQGRDADAPAFQIADTVDAFSSKQFETADVNARQQDDRFAGIDRGDPVRGMRHTEIDLAFGDGTGRGRRGGFDIADLGKALNSQQFLRDQLRCVAE
jgi:hypothetical protein